MFVVLCDIEDPRAGFLELNRHMKNNQKDAKKNANNTLHWNGAFIRETNIQEKEKSKQVEANKRPIKVKKERSLVRTERSISFPPPSLSFSTFF